MLTGDMEDKASRSERVIGRARRTQTASIACDFDAVAMQVGPHIAVTEGRRRTSMLKRLFTASVLVVLVHLMASGADAFTSDKRTYFTFNQSVALPGVTLPAGTYMFRLADPDTSSTRHSGERQGGHAELCAAADDACVSSGRRQGLGDPLPGNAAGAPRAINAWWYVGDNTGYQFIYSKQQLAELNRDQPARASCGRS